MLDYFRGRRPWRQLLRFVDKLPGHSRFMAELAQDEQLAELWLAQHGEDEPQPKPPLAGYDLTAQKLDNLCDAITHLRQVLLAVNGNKTGKPDLVPRPETAIDRVKARRSMEWHYSIVAQLLPSQ